MNRPEIMSPIRDFASLDACKTYADAVYFGISDNLSMRAHSGIKMSDMAKFIKKCHSFKIKAYLTINSAIYNNDLAKAEKLIKNAKASKIDAIIIWDLSLIEIAKKHRVTFFISTQANICNFKTALFYQKLGAQRIVLAREMSLQDIKKLKKKVKIEIETFVHGAMCLAISGRCILSSYLYSTSANCGACAQPCRKEWILQDPEGNKLVNQGQYFMSAKDLCMIKYVPELIKAGINSFKIEGRRRDPRYIEVTSRCYKEAVDAYFTKTFTQEKVKKWQAELDTVYNRGYSTGFYFSKPDKSGISYEKADNASLVKKVLVGYVTNYFANINVAEVDLKHHSLQINDKILVEGKTSFFEQKISSLENNHQKIHKAKKGELVAMKTDKRVRKNDKIFILK